MGRGIEGDNFKMKGDMSFSWKDWFQLQKNILSDHATDSMLLDNICDKKKKGKKEILSSQYRID